MTLEAHVGCLKHVAASRITFTQEKLILDSGCILFSSVNTAQCLNAKALVILALGQVDVPLTVARIFPLPMMLTDTFQREKRLAAVS